ncbi:MAG: hypothetical protein N3E45_05325 [Oscillatoriaceae bacterium SKW80]|nr:hypothetical protein [Oscillatoriaceae bacterium SKYG93]MCX8120236.1 hypothetical protein [Oscillatoriaceae bacterium SKW80]MDW8453162.1 hypothetical protein [Oscillatoriaceae cyanobacterium SKYGB_i_bin93]HIK28926.1 hypothetical protein [Oscillatoriaceae cyanobacterium M7585_C2015_266]
MQILLSLLPSIMNTLSYNLRHDSADTTAHSLAILSGDNIYLVSGNGDVKFIPSQLFANLKKMLPLEEYRFWGYLEIA